MRFLLLTPMVMNRLPPVVFVATAFAVFFFFKRCRDASAQGKRVKKVRIAVLR